MNSDLLENLGYEPVNIGVVHMKRNTVVYGAAYDHQRTLIALSVQGPNTQIEQIHYELQSRESNFAVIVKRDYDRFDRNMYSRNSHFKGFKSPIPDTNEVSMIMLNDMLFESRPDQMFSYLKAPDLKTFMNELYHRVKSIVFGPVLPEWAAYLYEYGIGQEDPNSRNMLCGILANRKDTTQWMSAGFSIGYCVGDQQPWQELISAGLKKGIIRFPELSEEDAMKISQNRSEVKLVPKQAVLLLSNGEQRIVTPKNGTDFDRFQLYDLIGCDTIEVANLNDGMILICDEEALLVDDPKLNTRATALYRQAYIDHDDSDQLAIFGNAVYCKDEMLL